MNIQSSESCTCLVVVECHWSWSLTSTWWQAQLEIIPPLMEYRPEMVGFEPIVFRMVGERSEYPITLPNFTTFSLYILNPFLIILPTLDFLFAFHSFKGWQIHFQRKRTLPLQMSMNGGYHLPWGGPPNHLSSFCQ